MEAIEQEYYGVGNKTGLAEGVPYTKEADGDAATWIRSKASLCTTELTMWYHSQGEKKKVDKTVSTLTKQLFLILL